MAKLKLIVLTGLMILIFAGVAFFLMSKRGKTSREYNPADPRAKNKINRNGLKIDKAEQTASAHSKQTVFNEIADDGFEAAAPPVQVQAIEKNAEDLLKKGQNYFRTGQYDKAVMQFSKEIKAGGNKKLALYNRGVALFKLNKKEAALKDFKYAAKLGHEKAMAILSKAQNSAAKDPA